MGSVAASYSWKHYVVEVLKWLSYLFSGDSMILLTGPAIYPKIYHRTPYPAVFICKGVQRKARKGSWLFRISQKWSLFSSLITTQLSWVPSHNMASFLVPSRKRPPPLLQFGPEENILGNSFEKRAYWFVFKAATGFPIPTGRVEKEWWTLL